MMKVRGIKWKIEKMLPKPLSSLYYRFLYPGDIISLIVFLFKPNPKVSFHQRLFIVKQLHVISSSIDCRHSQRDIIPFFEAILPMPHHIKGCIVEAGCYKGGSTAKFSMAAKMANRRLVVFDSFEGIPEHNEPYDKDIFGASATLQPGVLRATVDEVKRNVSRFGELGVCEFIKGWFDDTMPEFSKPVVAIYLDVDLASSTRTCLKYLYPLLVPGGVLYSHDGLYPLVNDVFNDNEFWEKEVGYPKPHLDGLGKQKVVKIVKPTSL